MRVRRQAATGMRDLLTESVELMLSQATFEESAGVDAGGGVALEEDLVATTGVIGAAEEVIESNFIKRCR